MWSADQSTHEFRTYDLLSRAGCRHGRVRCSRPRVDHIDHVESFWALFKNSIRSTHIYVSRKNLDGFAFRANHGAMFDLLIASV
jgi:hypothetical protein